MLYIYILVPVLCLLATVLLRNYRKELFHNLDSKEHPLMFLYPGIARVFDLVKGHLPKNAHSKVTHLMKQLCVKENVETEVYIYKIKKTASVLSIILGICIVGMLLCITSEADTPVRSLARSEHGSGQSSYQLDVEYNESRETIEISIDSVSYTEDEILSIFEDSYDSIISEMLAGNDSADHVTSPVNLIDSYGEITIKWEIDDTDVLNYNGEISEEVGENECVPVSLTATFTIDDTSEVFSVPLIVSANDSGALELLIQNILDSIESDNSEYEDSVALPETINGKTVTFREIESNDDSIFLILGLIAAAAIFFFYDRTLEDKAKKRQEQLLIDFTEIIFKLSLLYEAGLSIFKAWERIVTEHEASAPGSDRYAYMEMRLVLEKINSGIPEADAYGQFGKRCGIHQYIKLGNILEQNLSKGTRGMKDMLRQEAQEAFEMRKRLARKKGEEASTKMLVPMIMMLVIVIIIIAVPALMTLDL